MFGGRFLTKTMSGVMSLKQVFAYRYLIVWLHPLYCILRYSFRPSHRLSRFLLTSRHVHRACKTAHMALTIQLYPPNTQYPRHPSIPLGLPPAYQLPHHTTNRASLDLRCLVYHLLSTVRGEPAYNPGQQLFGTTRLFGNIWTGGHGTAFIEGVFL
jgi:hypothetical protein